MLDLNADIRKSINDILYDLRKQKERYAQSANKVDNVIKKIQEIDDAYNKLHEYDTTVKEVYEKTKQLQLADKDNVHTLKSFEQKLADFEPKLKRLESTLDRQDELTTALNNISKSIQELKNEKGKLLREFESLEDVYKKIHEYDKVAQEVFDKTTLLQQSDKDNVNTLKSFEQQIADFIPKLKNLKNAIIQQEKLTNDAIDKKGELSSAFRDISKTIEKLKTSKEELADEFENLSDQLNVMKKSNMYKTLKLLDSNDEEFFQKIAEYIVNNVVARQAGVFGVKDISLELVSDSE